MIWRPPSKRLPPSSLGLFSTAYRRAYGVTTKSGLSGCPAWPTSANGLSPARVLTGPQAPLWPHTKVPRRLRPKKCWRTHPSARRYASSWGSPHRSTGLQRSCCTALAGSGKMRRVQRVGPQPGPVMGKYLTRLAPSLRKLGYTVEFRRARRGNLWHLEAPQQATG